MERKLFDPVMTPYELHDQDFPREGTLEEQYRFLLQYVVLAPSTHNSQPWKFRVLQEGIEVYADYGRRMPVVDPGNRELLMSIGAAIMNLRVAAAHFGFSCHVSYNLSGDSESPVAVTRLAPFEQREQADRALAALHPAIVRRHTNRSPFLVSRVPRQVLERLTALARGLRAQLLVSTDGAVNGRVATLIAEADRRQLADPAFRKDLAEWVRPNRTRRTDGIPGEALGIHGLASALGQWATRVLDLGKLHAARDRNLCIEAPGLIVVASEDAVPHWLDAGELLERVLLTLAQEGLSVSYFNMPVQIPELRGRLRAMFSCVAWPQLLLRVGYSLADPVPTPRRPVDDVLLTPER